MTEAELLLARVANELENKSFSYELFGGRDIESQIIKAVLDQVANAIIRVLEKTI